ncbi:MAG: hypothetical protein ACM35F_07945 [Betaproteobacteria bacterium]
MTSRQTFPASFLDQAGLNRQHVFDLAALPEDMAAALGIRPGERQLILLGQGGRLVWERIQVDGCTGEHPIDDYTLRTIRRCFAEHLPESRYRILYPGDHPVGLQALGTLAGWHHASPFMVGIDGEWGTWYAYRAVILADTDFRPSPAVDRNSPCASCGDQPCIGACPAGAMAGGAFALDKCRAFRTRDDSPCAFTCLARLACPVGSTHRYDAGQLDHAYTASLRTLREYG